MEPKERNNESTPSVTKYENMAETAYQLTQSLTGPHEIKDSEKPLYERTYEFLSHVKRYSSIAKLSAFVILTPEPSRLRRLLRLHTNKRSLIIALSHSPTNNNTHTPAQQVETP